MTGPTPKRSVSVVPDARTAAVSFLAVQRAGDLGCQADDCGPGKIAAWNV
jgi:uncharacterized Zn-binding protein involved in type VI secretion